MDSKFAEVKPLDTLRHGWFNEYQVKQDAGAWADISETTAGSEEWQWECEVSDLLTIVE